MLMVLFLLVLVEEGVLEFTQSHLDYASSYLEERFVNAHVVFFDLPGQVNVLGAYIAVDYVFLVHVF